MLFAASQAESENSGGPQLDKRQSSESMQSSSQANIHFPPPPSSNPPTNEVRV